MRKITVIIVTLLASLMLLPLFSPPVSAEATAPTWEVNDSWAMGKEVDLGANLTNSISGLETLLERQGWTVNDITLNGKASAWVVFTVEEVTATDYVLKTEMGAKLAASAHVKGTGPMPAAGEYSSSINPLTDPSVPKENRTIEATLIADYALVVDGRNMLNKTNLAVKQIDYAAKTSAYISFVASNIPGTEESGSKIYLNYSNPKAVFKADVQVNLSVKFDPMLNLFNFPLDVGHTWTIDSEANVSGSIKGFVDASGLPAPVKEQIFNSEFANMTGAPDFPIDFGKLTTPDNKIVNGTITPFSVPIYADLRCTGKSWITVPGSGLVDVYAITANGKGGAEGKYCYRADEGFLSQIEASSVPGLPSEASSVMPHMTMESVDVATAASAIDSIEAYQTSVSNKANGVSTGSDATMLIIIAIIAIATAVMVAAVFLTRRKKF